jgi:hypothetical protein
MAWVFSRSFLLVACLNLLAEFLHGWCSCPRSSLFSFFVLRCLLVFPRLRVSFSVLFRQGQAVLGLAIISKPLVFIFPSKIIFLHCNSRVAAPTSQTLMSPHTRPKYNGRKKAAKREVKRRLTAHFGSPTLTYFLRPARLKLNCVKQKTSCTGAEWDIHWRACGPMTCLKPMA